MKNSINTGNEKPFPHRYRCHVLNIVYPLDRLQIHVVGSGDSPKSLSFFDDVVNPTEF
jgi:hypothetical protein